MRLDHGWHSMPLDLGALTCHCAATPDRDSVDDQTPSPAEEDLKGQRTPGFTALHIEGRDQPLESAVESANQLRGNVYFDPTQHWRSIVQLQKLALAFPGRPMIHQLLSSMTAGSKWELLPHYNQRAGVHVAPDHGWQPESPSLRIRKCLLGPHDSDYVLVGSNQLNMRVQDTKTTEFEISLRRPQIGFVPLAHTTAICETENGSHAITLKGTQRADKLRLRLNSGIQILRIRQANPLANHFLQISAREVLDSGVLAPINRPDTRATEAQRTYQVATVDEPLKFKVVGPTIIRIDQKRSLGVTSQIVPIESEREFELFPDQDQETALYRVYQLRLGHSSTPVYRPQPRTDLPTALAATDPEPWLQDGFFLEGPQNIAPTNSVASFNVLPLLAADADPVMLSLNDNCQLGLQELGTLGLGVGYRQRRALEEDFAGIAAGRFFEVELSRLAYDQWRDRYLHNQWLLRPRLETGPTFGFVHRGSIFRDACMNRCVEARRERVRFDWKGFLYVQHAGAPLNPPADDFPYSLGVQGSLSKFRRFNRFWSHRPKISIFWSHAQ